MKGQVREKPPKTTRSARTLALASFVVAALREQKALQGERRIGRGMGHATHADYPDTFGSRFFELVRRKKLAKVRLHDLRHSFASLSLIAGADLKLISAALGHSSIGITANVYMHVTQSLEGAHASGLDSLLGDTVAGALAVGSGPQRAHVTTLRTKKARKYGPELVAPADSNHYSGVPAQCTRPFLRHATERQPSLAQSPSIRTHTAGSRPKPLSTARAHRPSSFYSSVLRVQQSRIQRSLTVGSAGNPRCAGANMVAEILAADPHADVRIRTYWRILLWTALRTGHSIGPTLDDLLAETSLPRDRLGAPGRGAAALDVSSSSMSGQDTTSRTPKVVVPRIDALPRESHP